MIQDLTVNAARRLERERHTVEVMIRLYCRAHHGPTKGDLCGECLDLVRYTRRRLEKCPFGEDKPVCDRCPLHCFQVDIRSQIKKVMRYSGPRMMLRHPILATRHFLDAHRPIPGDGVTISPMAVDVQATADERRRTRRFFNLVTPAFHIIDRRLFPEYRNALEDLGLPPEMSILDIGTGTGTLARAFAERGHRVTGVDFAARLLRKARRRAPTAEFHTMDLVDLDVFEPGSFDVVALAYVLHGLDPQLQRLTLSHAARLARSGVLIFDYSGLGPWYVRLTEWVEGPHYPAFVARSMAEHLRPFGLEVNRTGKTSRFGAWWWADCTAAVTCSGSAKE